MEVVLSSCLITDTCCIGECIDCDRLDCSGRNVNCDLCFILFTVFIQEAEAACSDTVDCCCSVIGNLFHFRFCFSIFFNSRCFCSCRCFCSGCSAACQLIKSTSDHGSDRFGCECCAGYAINAVACLQAFICLQSTVCCSGITDTRSIRELRDLDRLDCSARYIECDLCFILVPFFIQEAEATGLCAVDSCCSVIGNFFCLRLCIGEVIAEGELRSLRSRGLCDCVGIVGDTCIRIEQCLGSIDTLLYCCGSQGST